MRAVRGWPGTGPTAFQGDVNVEAGNLGVTGGNITAAGDITLDDALGGFVTTLQCVTPTAARTISLPNATGTVGLVAGNSTQFTYNNVGAYAGLSTFTTDGTNVTLTGRFISGVANAASAPPLRLTGSWTVASGTATTWKPALLIEPSGATSTAWSTAGTGLGVNAASGFTGRLLDLQLNGTSNFNVDSTGRVSFPLATAALPALYPGADTNTGMWSPAADTLAWSTNGVERARIDASSNYILGNGDTNASPTAVTVSGTGGSGSNIAGANVTIRGGQSTGSAAGGEIILSTSSIAAAGSSANTAAERLRVGASGLTTIGSQASNGPALSTTVPARLYVGTGGYTDRVTANSGTVTHGTIAAFDNPAIASSGTSVTYTNASTVYIDGAPTNGSNVTITNAYSFYVNAGVSYFGGNAQFAAGANIVLATATGTKIGTATNQLLGFFNASPVAQQTVTTDLLDSLQALGLIASGAGNTPLDLTNGAFTAGSGSFSDHVNLASSKVYKINATQVVGARVTGWTAPTGTATRSTFATFAGQDISASPTEAEVQAIDDHLKVLSERLKALIDDLTTHGLIGA